MATRLLLVEDDPTSRAFLTAASEALPATVDSAGSIAAAMVLATQHDYALWMIDANLPDGSGASLLAGLRSRGFDTPALAHTAACDQRDLDALLAAGFTAAVSKPLAADAWRTALRSALSDDGADIDGMTTDSQTTGDLPLWDDDAALAAMHGNQQHVDALRSLFLAELPATQASAMEAFAGNDIEALHAVLHKLRAGCGFVGAKRLDAATSRLRAAPGSDEVRRDFIATLQDTLSS